MTIESGKLTFTLKYLAFYGICALDYWSVQRYTIPIRSEKKIVVKGKLYNVITQKSWVQQV